MLDDYVGIPWKDLGRDRDGSDCWGLLRMVYRDKLRLTLPSLSDEYPTAADTRHIVGLIEGRLSDWSDVPRGEEITLDAVLMTEAGQPRHVGVVVRPGYVLHMVPFKDSVIEPYTTGKLRHRISGFYRIRDRN